MPVARFAWILAASFVFLPGCFSEPKSDLPPGCSLGQHLCPCNGDACDPGLTCSVSADVCVSIDCEVGALECPCGMEGACNPGLVCGEYKYCVPEDGAASTAGTDDPSGTMSASMSAGVTSESESDATTMSTTTPVDPDTSVTDSDPSDSDPSASTTRGESSSSGDDPSMTTAMTDSDAESSSSGGDSDPSTSTTTAVVTDSASDSLETESASASSSATNGETDATPTCQDCLEDAQAGACAAEWQACEDAAFMNDTCVMTVATYINMCLLPNGGNDDGCLCMNPADELYGDFQACMTAACGTECNCY